MRNGARVIAAALCAATMLLTGLAGPAAAEEPPLPDRIASIGDSISQATDVCCFYGNWPGQAWSTGGSSWGGVTSHFERIRSANPGVTAFNGSRAGARMGDAPGQASSAVQQGADYVTILMGANDLCTSSAATMTSAATFRAQFEETMRILEGLPQGSHVFVSSIPNVYRLWQVLRGNPLAQSVWFLAQICQSLLSPTNNEAARQRVVQRELEFNAILEEVCARYANCRFDGNATYNFDFQASHVSVLDYFHPSLSGQATLARFTWAASWWPSVSPQQSTQRGDSRARARQEARTGR
jgi:lysophospholipase L1-like esterase